MIRFCPSLLSHNHRPATHPPSSLATPQERLGLSETCDLKLIPRPTPPLQPAQVAEKKATCPFIGAAVSGGQLALQASDRALASIQEVRRMGNSGGGDLGELLALFASGNHAFMPGPSGRLDQPVPPGLFSLDFPGSQGSHPGHSGILQGDPTQLNSGRFSAADFERLAARAQGGRVKRSEVGKFIAENLRRDPDSKVFSGKVVGLLAHDLVDFVLTLGPALHKLTGTPAQAEAAYRQLEIELTGLLGENNLVGSAGEFGLLFAFLANKPGAKQLDGEPTLALDDLRSMFVDKKLPEGWEDWKKTRLSWVIHTTGLLVSAGQAYLSQ
jgi:hypothetical protein